MLAVSARAVAAPGALALAAVLATGCGGSEGEPGADPGTESRALGSADLRRDLLVRAPDTVRAQPGALFVDPIAGWGEQDGGGWDRGATDPAEVERPRRWTDGPRAALQLPVLDRRDRRIEIEVVARIDGPPVEVAAELGGVALGTARIDTLPATLRFDAPSAAWTGAPLVLTVDRTEPLWRPRDEGGAIERGIAVSSVRYGDSRTVDRAPGASLALAPDTAVGWALARWARDGVRLEGRATAEDDGVLVVSWCPRTGGAVDESGPLDTVRLDVFAGEPLELSVPLSAAQLRAAQLRAAQLRAGAGSASGADSSTDTSTVASTASNAANDLALRLEWRTDGAAPVRFTSLGVSPARPVARPAVPLVVVSVDTLTAKALGAYGYARDTTPNLDAFAREAVVFERCRANTTSTIPSYVSQFTGHWPDANRVREADDPLPPDLWDRRLVAPQRWTFAEALRAHGYRTAGVVANPWLAMTRGVERGFETYDSTCSTHSLFEPEWGAQEVFRRGLEWLDDGERARDPRPPLLFLQVLDVHGPYLPGESFRGRFGSDDAQALPDLPIVESTALVARTVQRSHLPSIDPEHPRRGRVSARRLQAAYDENLAEFDAHFGAFLDGLRERELYDDALVVVTADHGETMADETFVFGHSFPAERTLHVPLMVKLPASRRAGLAVDAPVALVDLHPTLLEFAGLAVGDREGAVDEGGGGPSEGHGRSLVPFLTGELDARGSWSERVVVVQDGACRSRSAVSTRFKLVEYPVRDLHPAALLSMPAAYEVWAAFDPGTATVAARVGVVPERLGELWVEHDDPFAELAPARRIVASLSRFYAVDEARVHRELFDLAADPLGLVDVSAQHPDEVRRLAAVLDAAASRCESLRPDLRDTVPSNVAASNLDRLRELGYVDGD